MLAPMTPFEAYRTDLDRASQRSEFGTSDTVWLLLAHCLGRLAKAGTGVRAELAQQSAEALRDLLEGAEGAEGVDGAHLADLRLIVAGLAVMDSPSGADGVSRACRGFAARMAEAGALSVAYAVLGSARAAVTQACDRERGLLAADQARVARQIGEMETADELYRVAAMIGERAGDRELLSRSSLGRGVLARMRGNYPEARAHLSRGLSLAKQSDSTELEYWAHQGLTIVCGVIQDFDGALEHSWAAFGLSGGEAEREAESLNNLAQACLDAGYPQAALRVFLSALARLRSMRQRIPALGGAALAAGRCGDGNTLARLTREAEASVGQSGLPYENAHALMQLALAHMAVGDDLAAERQRRAAMLLAERHGFHELSISCERHALADVVKAPVLRRLEVGNEGLVSDLESFETETSDSAFLLTRSG